MLVLKAPMAALMRSGCLRPATLWTITRADGVILRFTDHDVPIVIGSDEFEPAAADVSARQKRASLASQNREFKGAIESDRVTHEDLAAGRYRGARVLEQVVDWLYPWLGEFERAEYDITETTYSGESWSAQIDGISVRLSRSVGRVYSRDCDAFLGDARCGKDVSTFTYSATVSSVSVERLVFDSSLSSGLADNLFASGRLTWTSGLNVGLVCDVQSSTGTGGRVRLEIATPFAIAASDGFTIVAGCDGNFSTCGTKFSNRTNFRGHPYQPGVNEVLKVPDPK